MPTITVLDKSNAPMGPFTRAQITEKLQSGEISLESLAFIEGLSQWTPLREILAKVDGAATPLTPPPMVSGSPVSAYASPQSLHSTGEVRYAGFWLRFAAYFVDALIVGIPMNIIATIGWVAYIAIYPGSNLSFVDNDGNPNIGFSLLYLTFMLFSVTVSWLYYALQESSAAQATLGKRVLGLKVTNLSGQPIGFAQASGRFFGKILSGMILMIGYIMAGVTERKQALHDLLANTLVVKK